MRDGRLAAMVLACAVAVGASTEGRRPPRPKVLPEPAFPSTQPTAAQPLASLPTVVLPAQWEILLKRSIFARGGVPAPVAGAAGPGGPEGGPDSHLALRGVVLEDSQYSAFLEDPAGHRTVRVRPGDKLGAGRVKAINLDSLVFETPLRTTHVQVGENLMGAPAPAPAAQPAHPAGPPGPLPQGPHEGPMPNLPPGMPPEMARKMMMMREAQMAATPAAK